MKLILFLEVNYIKTKMKHHFVTLISQLTPITKEEEFAIINTYIIKNFKKGDYLLKAGELSEESYYVINGCVREYKLTDGEEDTINFYTENQSFSNYDSIYNKAPSKINFICSEPTILVVINIEKEKAFYNTFSRFKEYCLDEMDKIIGEQRQQLTDFYRLKPEQRYLKIVSERPDLIQRVPQHQIASFLGIKPETLSRIRARLVKN